MAGPSTIDQVVAGIIGYEPEKVILFGSAARGETDEFSDIDLIVIKDTEERFFQRLLNVTAYLPRDVTIDVLVYTPGEIEAMVKGGNPFIQQALEEGQVLYEKPPGGGEGNLAPPWEKPVQKGRSFVKEALETARRWLAQAQYNLSMAEVLLERASMLSRRLNWRSRRSSTLGDGVILPSTRSWSWQGSAPARTATSRLLWSMAGSWTGIICPPGTPTRCRRRRCPLSPSRTGKPGKRSAMLPRWLN